MIISDILNKEYKLCDFEEREKSVIYRDVDLDSLILKDSIRDEFEFELTLEKRRKIYE